MTDVCRRCKTPIVWATTEHGNPMPLDPTPTTDGNVAITHTGTGTAVAVVLAPKLVRELAGDVELYMSHFATCPYADELRKR